MPCFLTQLFAPSLSVLLLTSLPPSSGVQNTPTGNQTPVKPAGNGSAPPLITLDIADVSLRLVLRGVFNHAGAEYSLDADVPDIKVNLKVTDQSLETVLGLIFQQAKSQGKRLTYVKEGLLYRIRAVPENTEPSVLHMIRVHNMRAETLSPQIQALVPEAVILTDQRTNGLIVRGTEESIIRTQNAVRMLDVARTSLLLKAEVVLVPAGTGVLDKWRNRGTQSVLISTIQRSLSGQETESEDRISSPPTQTSRLSLRATPLSVGNGTYEVTTRWDVSLPLLASKVGAFTKKESLVQIEKRLTNTTRLIPGQTSVIGGIILNQYGLKGEILFLLTVTEVKETK